MGLNNFQLENKNKNKKKKKKKLKKIFTYLSILKIFLIIKK